MTTTTKSLRTFLQGSLNDFADSCQMTPLVTATTLTSLVVLLANLKEEGAELTPEVYLCENLSEVLKLLPDKDVLIIGSAVEPIFAIKEGLKKCSPLAIGGWNVYFSPIEGRYQYGLFRGSLNPLSISVNSALLSVPLESIRIVRLFRTATGCVELSNSASNTQCILLNDRQDGGPKPNAHSETLPNLICQDVPLDLQERTATYIGKTLQRALASCHGTLIVITKRKTVPPFLKDGVVLIQPLDLYAAVETKTQFGLEVTNEHRLIAYSSLIQGMIGSDGITVFSTKGKLLAYNCFIQSANQIDGKPVVGGARTRAYEALVKKIGNGIEAVFIQSQDGWTKLSKV